MSGLGVRGQRKSVGERVVSETLFCPLIPNPFV